MKASRAITAVVLAAIAAGSSGAQSSTIRPKLGENSQVFVIRVASGKVKRLTHDGRDYSGPVWSPDGRRLAMYSGSRLEVRTHSGRLLRHFGAGEGGADSPPAWSPDGREVAFLRTHDARDGAVVGALTIAHLSDGRRRTLAARAESVAWSPDGRRIAYVHGAVTGGDGPDPEELRVVPAAGGKRRTLLRHVESYGYPQWSPDGQRIVADRTGPHHFMEVWTVGPRGRSPRRVAGHMITSVAQWVPRRRRWIAVSVGDAQGGHAFLYRPHRRRRALNRRIGDFWAWSPTRDLIAYFWGDQIRLTRPGGGHDRLLARIKGAEMFDIAWSHDGRRLAVSAHKQPVED